MKIIVDLTNRFANLRMSPRLTHNTKRNTDMKTPHNKKALTLAWGMSNKTAAMFAKHEKFTGDEWYFCPKNADKNTIAAATALKELGLAEFVRLTKKKADEAKANRESEEETLPAWTHVLGSTRGLANWK